ncbi:MAG: imidazole glycerol phosphate synthase subunit HisH [Candidatus Wallbacteria bacterium]|nr:imidazole glycerol phosphate synthase subunit HisH [Candidatus Wallbacteria bacterium]
MIAIIDYGAGNLASVKKAFDYIGAPSEIIVSPEGLLNCDRLVLPGVGAFGAAVSRLKETGLFQSVESWLQSGRPFLGICLGMQLLLEGSDESPGACGFGFFRGFCRKFTQGKVPQIGWNTVKPSGRSNLFSDGEYFYFLHGFFADPVDRSAIAAETDYGIVYPSALLSGKVLGVQFHPEKSGDPGLNLLKGWLSHDHS